MISHTFLPTLASSIAGWCKKKSETLFGLLQTGSCRDRPGTVNTLKYLFFGSTLGKSLSLDCSIHSYTFIFISWFKKKKRILTLSNHSLGWISVPVKPATTIVVLSLSRSTSWATGANRTTTDRDESSCWKKNGTFYRFIASLILVARLEQILKSPLALLKLFYCKPLNPS